MAMPVDSSNRLGAAQKPTRVSKTLYATRLRPSRFATHLFALQTDRIGKFPRGIQIHFRKQDAELLAARSRDVTLVATLLPQHACQRLQHFVACCMSVLVVDSLEGIDIDHDTAQASSNILSLVLALRYRMEATPVEQPGQPVDHRKISIARGEHREHQGKARNR